MIGTEAVRNEFGTAPRQISGKGNILVVDDDPAIRTLIVEALRQTGNYIAAEASDGKEAIEALRSNFFDLVISDIHMPGMNGMDLLDRIRKTDPAVFVIMITGYPTVDMSVSAMKTGAVDFLSKPFRIDELLCKVDVYLREKQLLSADGLLHKVEHDKMREKARHVSAKGFIYDFIDRHGVSNDNIFRVIADLALKISNAEHGAILLHDKAADEFLPKVNVGADLPIPRMTTPWPKKLLREVMTRREGIVQNVSDPKDRASVLCVPLMIRNNPFGILALWKSRSGSFFTDHDLHVIVSLAKRASLNFENKVLYETLYTNLAETFGALVTSIQARDQYTERHSVSVMRFAVRTAEIMGCSSDDIECLKIASMLHDIGKIAIPDHILLKPDGLSEVEYEIIKSHSTIGNDILTPVALFEQERTVIRHHHENWDGTGYPDGLSGDEIPLLSRLIAVADAYDAMTTNRPYRLSMSHHEALAELRQASGSQFDPRVVESFIRSFQDGKDTPFPVLVSPVR